MVPPIILEPSLQFGDKDPNFLWHSQESSQHTTGESSTATWNQPEAR